MNTSTSAAAHARLSPSSASAWMTCAGYPNANDGLPDDESEFAREGTIAHEISDACLALCLDAHDFIGLRTIHHPWEFEWTEDDADYLQPGIEWTRSQPGKFFGEHRVDISEWTLPGQFGTLDRGIVSPTLITISDLKYGRGVAVSPVRNKQLQLYALGFWRSVARHYTDAKEFLIHIDQPRNAAGGGEWRTTLKDLLAFGEEASAAARRTLDPDARRTASKDACMWCKRKNAPGGCSTYDEFLADMIGQKFDDLDAPPLVLPSELTPERRTTLIQHSKMIEIWLADLHSAALDDAKAGRPVPGLKAVLGRKSADKFVDTAAAQASLEPALGDSLFNKKLKTPTQLSKMLPSERFSRIVKPLVSVGERKPILVPEDDAREAITPIAEKFDDVNGDF